MVKDRSRALRLVLKEFPEGEWQVLWYGDLTYEPGSGLRTQPLISLVLRSLSSGGTKRVSVPFSLIAAIPLGSVWKDRSRTVERPISDFVARTFHVFPNRVSDARASDRLDGTRAGASPYVLDYRSFNLHNDDPSTPCLRWQTPDGEIVMLPATVAINFYFGTSSHLLQRIVTADPPLDSMWLDKAIDVTTGHASITLAPSVPTAPSAQQIGRIAFDKDTRAAADLVFRSLQISSVYRQPLYPRMRFPTKKPSTIQVAGLPVTSSSGPTRFVIMRIDSCTGAYPFHDLEVLGGLENDANRRNREEVGDPNEPLQTSDDLIVHNVEPDVARAGRSESQFVGHRFPDLIRKKVTYRAGPSPESARAGRTPAASTTFGMGDGTWSGEGQRLDIGVFDSPDRVAFVDDRLVSFEVGALGITWTDLQSALLDGLPRIQPVLLTPSPDHAKSIEADQVLLLEEPVQEGAWHDGSVLAGFATRWAEQAELELPRSWIVFSLHATFRPVTGLQTEPRAADLDLVSTIQQAFEVPSWPVGVDALGTYEF